MRAVGYRQLWQHLAGQSSLEDAVASALAATRQLAKRQLTWLRKWDEIGWIYTDSVGKVEKNGIPWLAEDCRGEAPLRLILASLYGNTL